MVSPEFFINRLKENGVDFYAGVPDSLLKNVCAYITDHLPAERNLITANEGCAIGVAAGHYLATSALPVVYMQNSGIGNAVNPLLSLADAKVYSIPMILVIGWRGEPDVHDEPQHVKQGEVTLPLLSTMGIPYEILPENEDNAGAVIDEMARMAKSESRPVALVIRKNTFDKYKLKNVTTSDAPLSREEAMKIVVDNLPENAVVVSTTGKLSRELFEYRESKSQGHGNDFLTVGSMGHASSIALGIALAQPDRPVFCFDGDGAFIMHMGALSNIGALAPKNLIHVLFNNGAHESVGAQPTLGRQINVNDIAKACGYAHATTVREESQISKALICSRDNSDGAMLIEIDVGINSRDDLGRPTTTPIQNKNSFMSILQK